MATKKITELAALTAANAASADVLPIVDISDGSGGTTKKITLTSIKSGSFSGSFQGSGASLTGITAEWDGSHNGDASITGSLIVSGSSPTSITLGDGSVWSVSNPSGSMHFSGSTYFSGSFNQLGTLTNTGTFNNSGSFTNTGSLNQSGSVSITGSMTISGSLTVGGGTVVISSQTSSFTTNTGSLGSTSLTGSLTISGSLNLTGSLNITGSTINNTGPFNQTGVSTILGDVNFANTGATYISSSGKTYYHFGPGGDGDIQPRITPTGFYLNQADDSQPILTVNGTGGYLRFGSANTGGAYKGMRFYPSGSDNFTHTRILADGTLQGRRGQWGDTVGWSIDPSGSISGSSLEVTGDITVKSGGNITVQSGSVIISSSAAIWLDAGEGVSKAANDSFEVNLGYTSEGPYTNNVFKVSPSTTAVGEGIVDVPHTLDVGTIIKLTKADTRTYGNVSGSIVPYKDNFHNLGSDGKAPGLGTLPPIYFRTGSINFITASYIESTTFGEINTTALDLAEGNITNVGQITCDQLFADAAPANVFNLNSTNFQFSIGEVDKAIINAQGLSITGHITASGNISSSGNFEGTNNLLFPVTSSVLTGTSLVMTTANFPSNTRQKLSCTEVEAPSILTLPTVASTEGYTYTFDFSGNNLAEGAELFISASNGETTLNGNAMCSDGNEVFQSAHKINFASPIVVHKSSMIRCTSNGSVWTVEAFVAAGDKDNVTAT